MDTRTNHLVSPEFLRHLTAEQRERYTLVPEDLARAADQILAGRSDATVSKTSGGKLSKWAKQKERELARSGLPAQLPSPTAPAQRARRKAIEKATRRRNRGKR